jgi:predicted secreted Zn-dependent protease
MSWKLTASPPEPPPSLKASWQTFAAGSSFTFVVY